MTDWRCVLHLAPDPQGELALARTLVVYQELAAWLDRHVPAGHPANLVALHRAWYERARRETRLPAQMVTLALRDWVARRRGEITEGVPYDRKLFSVRGLEQVSLATIDGRVSIPCAVNGYVAAAGSSLARLTRRDDEWSLTVEVPSELPMLSRRRPAMTPDSVLSRVGRVITGLTHAAVAAAEQASPAAVIEQAVREIDGAIEEVRASLGKATAEQHRIDLRLDELRTEHEGLEAKVKVALEAQREDLARAGVARQVDIEAQTEVLKKLRAEVSQRVGELEGMIDAMWASRREAEDRLRDYRRTMASPDSAAPPGAETSHDRATARVERAQGVVERLTGVPGEPPRPDQRALEELDDLRRQRLIEERLRRLRAPEA
jgi:phage shock protein A